MSRYWSATVRSLTPYTPGEQPQRAGLIKLNTNENPYGPSPLALQAMQAEIKDSLRLYPDPESTRLQTAIAAYYGLDTAAVFLGNGSDEVLAFVFQALLKHEAPLLFPDITYSFYPVYCALYDIDYQCIPLDTDFAIDISDYLTPEHQTNGGIIFPNPNAPTGHALSLDQITTLLRANRNSVVVIDEAYVDFGAESAVCLLAQFDNLLIVQTFSKSRALAGLRVGFALGAPDLIAALNRIKNSFNSYPLDRIAMSGAAAAMADTAHFENSRQAIMKNRAQLVQALTALGFSGVRSAANFIFVRHRQHDAKKLLQALRQRNIFVRHFDTPRIAQYLRITIGNEEECAALVVALTEILA